MAHLNIKLPGAPAQDAELGLGCHRVGRSRNTDLQLCDASVSNAHCEIVVEDGPWLVKDLGSTNGTFIDGQRVSEATFSEEQILRLGQVEITRLASGESPASLPLSSRPVARLRSARLALPAKARPAKSFYQSLPSAFIYPFKGNGWGLLLGGTIAFGLVSYLYGLKMGNFRVISFAACVALPLGFLASGYLFSFLQSIVTDSALGNHEIPSWPDFDNLWDSGFRPFLQIFASFMASTLPCLLYIYSVKNPVTEISLGLLALGMTYLPMSLLAVSIYDSVFALNPLLTFPSIVKVPRPYFLCCLILGVLWVATSVLQSQVRKLMPNDIVPVVITEFLFLYSLCVEMRILGLLYFTNKKEFAWKL